MYLVSVIFILLCRAKVIHSFLHNVKAMLIKFILYFCTVVCLQVLDALKPMWYEAQCGDGREPVNANKNRREDVIPCKV